MKFNIITLGCKVNTYESEYIKEQFLKSNYKEVSLQDEPNVIIINTCSVTNQSDAKSRHVIRQAKRTCENAIIVVCGCSAQNHKEQLLELGIDILIGNKDKSKIVDLVEKYKKSSQSISKFYDMSNQNFEDMMLESKTDKTRAFVKIQDGCDNFCSYCIIPYLRGNIRSKDIEIAEKEIELLVNMGHSEVVLTGIHTGSYGRGKGYDLVDLIRRISKLENLKRIRISSIEITELDDKFLDELKHNSKICDHLHIPLQSGSDVVLKKMNRKYNTNYYLNVINKIRSIRPNINITTDLIVGFPYETDLEFENTFQFLKQVNFTKIHTFPFSLRSGTKAEEMKSHFIDEKIKKERVRRVLDLSSELENKYYHKFIGTTLEIIIETSKDGMSRGHTSNYIMINLKEELEEGISTNVNITSVDGLFVNGQREIIE